MVLSASKIKTVQARKVCTLTVESLDFKGTQARRDLLRDKTFWISIGYIYNLNLPIVWTAIVFWLCLCGHGLCQFIDFNGAAPARYACLKTDCHLWTCTKNSQWPHVLFLAWARATSGVGTRKAGFSSMVCCKGQWLAGSSVKRQSLFLLTGRCLVCPCQGTSEKLRCSMASTSARRIPVTISYMGFWQSSTVVWIAGATKYTAWSKFLDG